MKVPIAGGRYPPTLAVVSVLKFYFILFLIYYFLFMASALFFVLFLVFIGIPPARSPRSTKTIQYVLKTILEGLFLGGGGKGSFGQNDIDW